MADLATVTAWIDAYRRAWETSDPAAVGALFTSDAEYLTAPFREPWRGRDAIVEGWLAHRDAPGETTFAWWPVVLTDDVAVVQATTTYPGTAYSNLWILRLDAAGRCRSFTEWWMEHPAR